MNRSEHILFFTGAGISVDSDIPTFIEQEGIRDRLSRDFANKHPEEYRKVISEMLTSCENTEPNNAHIAKSDLGCKVITINVDNLHTKARSKEVLEIHGVLPTREQLNEPDFHLTYNDIVLYEDLAPKYSEAKKLVRSLSYNNPYFSIVGTSFYTGVSNELLKISRQIKASIVIVSDNALERVPIVCENLKIRRLYEDRYNDYRFV